MSTETTTTTGAVIHDRRPENQREQFGFVLMTDSFMSGWGKAPGRSLFAVPVSNWRQAETVLENARNRSEMKRPRFVRTLRNVKLYRGDHLSIRAPGDSGRWYTPGGFTE